MKTAILTLQLLACLFWVPGLMAREPDNLEQIQRETRILADVMKSSLRGEFRNDVRVTSVSAEYLPMQGVLVSVNLNAPWLTINDGNANIAINGNLALNEIPAMVENILADLQIDINSYEPEGVNELRALRTEQRELRQQQRDIRSDLREQRRALVRSEGAAERARINGEIEQLEQSLADSEAYYDQLSATIDAQYQQLKDQRAGSSKPDQAADENDWASLVARHACDYGGTLKSLRGDDYLTLALRRDGATDYYSFRMDHVKECSSGDMRTDRLSELVYHYSN